MRWHAVLWLYLSIALVFIGIGYLLYRYGKLKNPWVQRSYLILFGALMAIYIAEGYLRMGRKYTMYSEDREGVFVNPAERMQKTWYMRGLPHQNRTLQSGSEYSFDRLTNSEGFSDTEWTIDKDSTEIRVLTLGDSFTEGDGAPSDSSYPSLLSGLIQRDLPLLKVRVMNAGFSGSDPWFEYKILSDLLLKYHPDIVVFTNGSNDLLFDHLCYGGMERFAPDSTVRNKFHTPRWLGLYEVSYIFRAIVGTRGYDLSLFSKQERDSNMLTSLRDAKMLLSDFDRLAEHNHFQCVQVLLPQKNEIEDNRYTFSKTELLKDADTLTFVTKWDLLQFYKDSIGMDGLQTSSYFWRVDQHHNAKGYAAMARGVYYAIKPELEKRQRLNAEARR
jgi:lysophospholipase L1-like esterase